MKRLMKNNKGLTLLELIVSFALLGIVSAAVVGLVSTGAGTYRSVNTEVSLQYESQLTMNQLQEYLIDCNGGIFWDSATKTLYVADRADADAAGDPAVITVHRFQQKDREIYYSSGTVTGQACDFGEEYLLSSYVDVFDFSYTHRTDSTGRSLCSSCIVTLRLTLGTRSYEAQQSLTMRNPALTSSNYANWLKLVSGT